MNGDTTFDFPIEPERYELQTSLDDSFDIEPTRREFLRVLGGGLVVLCLIRENEAEAQSGGGRRRGSGGTLPREIGAWLHIAEDGAISAYTGKAEVGQNIRTSLAQAVADELRVPTASVQLVMADTARTPYDMGTFGSRTTPTMAAQLRKVAATARERLIDLAAEHWKTDRATIEISNGKATSRATGQSLGLGALTQGRKLLETIGENAPTTPAGKWEAAGQSAPKADGRAFVTGRHVYASDVKRPGMLYGKVLRPPTFHTEPTSVDTSRAKALPGVTVVHEGKFIGVVAPDEPTANRALAAIRAEWTTADQSSDRDLVQTLKGTTTAAEGGRSGPSNGERGSVADGLASAALKVEETYTIAYIAHVPLEPRAAVAEWQGDDLTVWTGTQRPFGVRGELAQALGVPEGRVRVIVPDTGGGYGGKHNGEAAVEAARLARAAGRPVKRVWSREEEFTWAYFRPAGVIDVKAGARKDGTLTAWEFHNYNSGGSGLETPYDVTNRRVAFHAAKSPLRQGSYRALASTANHFARESVMDELARGLGIDPLAFRLMNLKDDRLRAVLKAAADRFGWGKVAGPDRGVGIAGGTEKRGYVATCAEVTIDRSTSQVQVTRLVTAFECGAIVNPDHLSNQVEGAIVMGLGGALFEAIRFEGGKILNPRLSRYRVPRFSDMPTIDVVLLDRKDLPSAGAGEAPIIAVAPAVGNAIFDAAKVRLRSLPLVPNGLKT
ncbi:molybdopterin cofactor-binding domain-containing protein [Singulisphaera sp. Ch08]|uniref:Molybdopterin cofactor-binding domain-containing protein n=1 Tax=Singulisphaera sp. Ch08 TaxID=3120278 RepID=A0AAU7CA00_9BACT